MQKYFIYILESEGFKVFINALQLCVVYWWLVQSQNDTQNNIIHSKELTWP